jgi:hypothetical protein
MRCVTHNTKEAGLTNYNTEPEKEMMFDILKR